MKNRKRSLPPRYLSSRKGWVNEEEPDSFVKITPIKVWSYRQYNECCLEIGGPGNWHAPTVEEYEALSGFEKGLVFEAAPRQQSDRPPVMQVTTVVRLVDAEVAALAKPFSADDLLKADRSFTIPMSKWDEFLARVGREQIRDTSVQWTEVERVFNEATAVAGRLAEIVAQENAVDGQVADMIAEYAALATRAREEVDRLAQLLAQLETLKGNLDQEPGRFAEKIRLAEMVNHLCGHLAAFKDAPGRLYAKSQTLLAAASLPQCSSQPDILRWERLAQAIQQAYPEAIVITRSDHVLVRLGASLVAFLPGEIRWVKLDVDT